MASRRHWSPAESAARKIRGPQILPKRSCAGFISAQWNGAETGSITARLAPLCEAISTARFTALALPEITVCSGEFKFAGDTTSPCAAFLQTSATSAGESPKSRPSRLRRRAPLPAYIARDAARVSRHRRTRARRRQRAPNIRPGYVPRRNPAASLAIRARDRPPPKRSESPVAYSR